MQVSHFWIKYLKHSILYLIQNKVGYFSARFLKKSGYEYIVNRRNFGKRQFSTFSDSPSRAESLSPVTNKAPMETPSLDKSQERVKYLPIHVTTLSCFTGVNSPGYGITHDRPTCASQQIWARKNPPLTLEGPGSPRQLQRTWPEHRH